MENKILEQINDMFNTNEEQFLLYNFIKKLNDMPLNFNELIYNQLTDEILKLCVNFKRIGGSQYGS